MTRSTCMRMLAMLLVSSTSAAVNCVFLLQECIALLALHQQNLQCQTLGWPAQCLQEAISEEGHYVQ